MHGSVASLSEDRELRQDEVIPGEVSLLYWEKLGVPETNLMKIIRFMGGSVKLVKLTAEGNQEEFGHLVPACRRLVLSAQALGRMARLAGWREFLMGLSQNILVYGFGANQADGALLRELSRGSLSGVAPAPAKGGRITVGTGARKICVQMSGLGFDRTETDGQLTFAGDLDRQLALVSIDQRPFFVRFDEGGRQLMLLAGQQIADLDARTPRGTSLLQFFCRLAPALMFLRGSSEHEFWENDAPAACLVIDDPLLKSQYGFLEYKQLLGLMNRERFCTSIAFIPWNFKRSELGLAKMFRDNLRRYSLCIHGSDHTRGEFGTSDETLLQQKAWEALQRMERHRELSGVGFDDVMVFPKCIFTTAAMKALKRRGYLAVANSSEFPLDAPEGLLLRELLEVALTGFSNLPLFIRRSAGNLAELAFDLSWVSRRYWSNTMGYSAMVTRNLPRLSRTLIVWTEIWNG